MQKLYTLINNKFDDEGYLIKLMTLQIMIRVIK